jgi:hypothetical protein
MGEIKAREEYAPITSNYFFFLGFFFFTPPEAGPPPAEGVTAALLAAASEPLSAATAGAAETDEAGCSGCWSREEFCIFCIRDRLSASNLFRNIEEWVLNLRH